MSRILHRSQFATPPIAVSGKGMYLVGADGRQIIDGSGGAAVACLGHGHPQVIAAIKAQLDTLAYAHTALFSCESAEELADIMVGHAPGGLTHAYFCSSGSEGNEAAIKHYETALVSLGELYRDQKKVDALAELVKQARSVLSSFAKAKTSKLGMPHALQLQGSMSRLS